MSKLRWLVAGVGVSLSLAPAASAASWTIQPVPSPVLHNGQLMSVSCTSAAACTAVGYGGVGDKYQTLAERWDGNSWSIQQMPIAGDDTLLNAVSCAGRTSCMAVGSGDAPSGALAEIWNGVSWSILPTPSVGDNDALLSGVSCVSPTDCVAVGNYNVMSDGQYDGYALVETWNGQSWSVQPAPSPSGGLNSQLTAVSCTSAAACTAVGSYENASYKELPLAERWDGQGWSIQTVPTPPEVGNDSFAGVSCSSATACVAVGSGSEGTPLAEGWDGEAWSIEATPTSGGGGNMDGVSCASPTACVGVGHGTDGTLAESLAGSSWSIQSTPSFDGALFVALNAVSCIGGGACIAVGAEDAEDGGSELAVSDRLDSGEWSDQSIPTPVFSDPAGMSSISCPSMSFCAAVGDGGDSGAFADMWLGGTWSVIGIPTPADALITDLSSVSCTSSSFCIAVGSYCFDACNDAATLTELWNGSIWAIQSSPNNPNLNADGLSGVSCTAPNACTAVGSAGAERWDGNSWSLQSVPPTNSTALSSISCTSSTSCTAISSGSAETWDGTSWSDPVTAESGPLSDVSCPISTSCIAVGYDAPVAYYLEQTLAAQFDGSTWTTQTTPSPNSQISRLYGVSCATATACTAVGSGNGTLVERWDGSTWSVQPSPNPSNAGSTIPQLTAVSCTENTACVAIGSSNAGPLVEQYVSGPAMSVKVSLAPSTIVANGRSQTTVTASVLNAYGSRLSGDELNFTSSDTGESIGPVTDNGDGTYTSTITSSSTPGPVTITATDSSGPLNVSGRATLTQVAIGPPTATITSPADDRAYALGEVVRASYSCDEGADGPGIRSCAGTVPDGAAIDTSVLGRHAFTVKATSNDGQEHTTTIHYVVVPRGRTRSSRFAVSDVKPQRNGTTSLEVNVPGGGMLEIVETTSNDDLALGSPHHRVPQHYVLARKLVHVSRAGKIRVRLLLDRPSRSLVRAEARRFAFTLQVTFEPAHGPRRRIEVRGLRL